MKVGLRWLMLTIFLCLFGLVSIGQIVHPSNSYAFLQDEVAEVRITIHPDSLNLLLDNNNLTSNHEYPVVFKYITSTGIDSMVNVGFRLRGNTSRYAAKKSFKVSFNTFDPTKRWNDLKKLNLNGEHNDVSILRSWLSNKLLAENGGIAVRNSFVKLYINNEYKGLYFNAEHIDKPFITARFGVDNDGNLFKAAYGSTLAYWGSNSSNYTANYELKTNETTPDYSGLIHFLDVLNNTPANSFPCAIQEVFDVDTYLKTLAMEVLIGHWDGYSFNKNNFYLYQNPLDGRFVFIEYDMDNTFGIDWVGVNWEQRNVYTWANNSDPRPLFSKLMAVPYFKDRYTFYLQNLLNDDFQQPSLLAELQAKQAMIQAAAYADVYKSYDYGFTNSDFSFALTQAWGSHVTSSISSYILNRRNSALQQLNSTGAINPCGLGLEENVLEEFVPAFALDMLGRRIPLDTKNILKIWVDAQGRTQKVFDPAF